MLPELFSVGSTMQDFPKEDFGFLNVNCYNEKATGDLIELETGSGTSSHSNKTVQHQQTQNTKKLEDNTGELYKWHFNNIGINLLRTPDDPLISSVQENSDQNDNELVEQKKKPSPPSATISLQPIIQSPEQDLDNENLIKPQQKPMKDQQQDLQSNFQITKTKTHKIRRKGPIKLRFHHQALPQEYLNHYESQQKNFAQRETQQQQQQTTTQQQVSKSLLKKNQSVQKPPVANGDDKNLNNENIINWLQNILNIQQKEEPRVAKELKVKTSNSTVTSNTMTNVIAPPIVTTSKPQNLKDLPYMGEMTLENTKPRRGRKPKKADICHLIYKNYGTIVPGSVAPTITSSPATTVSKKLSLNETLTKKKAEKSTVSVKKISKLLKQQEKTVKVSAAPRSQNEPLNLCIRDTSILISDDNDEDETLNKHVNDFVDCCDKDSIDLEFSSTIPSLISPLDLSGELPSVIKSDVSNKVSELFPDMPSSPSTSTPQPNAGGPNNGYIYWPSAGIFIHPMALYYQKMVDEQMPPLNSSASSSTSSLSSVFNNENSVEGGPQVSLESPPTPLLPSKPDFDMESLSQMIKSENLLSDYPDVSAKSSTPQSPINTVQKKIIQEPSSPSVASTSSLSAQTPSTSTKRKRSAIFIPPVQIENSTNPATEVSICKFKFTGGAKPSLQEKKILSVDAGGNFRYYSGTGDKSMRGYEFFPRESLRQSSLQSCSHTNAFLNASGEKIPLDVLPLSVDLNYKLLQLSNDLPKENKNIENENIPNLEEMENFEENLVKKTLNPKSEERLGKKKKSSNRSLQRAKLEKTFKEKGFLIQTQQLQSAEGATYCKFRQLRKFTRYLFRSWKDYLPADEMDNKQKLNLQKQQALLPSDLPSPQSSRSSSKL